MLFLFLVISCGCKATYPKEQILKSIVSLCKEETGRDIEVVQRGKTLYSILHLQDLLDQDMQLSEETIDIIQDVMLCVNRVSLSTNADIDFFVVIIIDDISGIEIVFTQYVDDLRRWILFNISRNDFYARSLTDISKHEPGYILDTSKLAEINMPLFIARQVASRIKKILEKDVVMQILMNVETVKGIYSDKSFDYFITKIAKDSPMRETIKDKDFDIFSSLKTVHHDVCKKYKFDDYSFARIRVENDPNVKTFYSQPIKR